MKKRVGILGASGYTGMELLRLLSMHARFEPVVATADQLKGQVIASLNPTLSHLGVTHFLSTEEAKETINECDLIFSALPHGEGAKYLPELQNHIIVDLSGDFRLTDSALYPEWYKFEHPAKSQLGKWVYGIPELFRNEIKNAARIANPGCYATAAILAAAPLAALTDGQITFVGCSGTSGAGRSPKPSLHFAQVAEDLRPYNVAIHQHVPEIELILEKVSGRRNLVTFIPVLAPMVRGILMTAVVRMSKSLSEDDLFSLLSGFYKGEKFIRVLREAPGTKQVRGSNHALLYGTVDKRAGTTIITCVIDNLMKGAAGQALQNANLAFDFPEDAGLDFSSVYP